MNLPRCKEHQISFWSVQCNKHFILIGPTPEELAEMERIETEKRVGVFSLFYFFIYFF